MVEVCSEFAMIAMGGAIETLRDSTVHYCSISFTALFRLRLITNHYKSLEIITNSLQISNTQLFTIFWYNDTLSFTFKLYNQFFKSLI